MRMTRRTATTFQAALVLVGIAALALSARAAADARAQIDALYSRYHAMGQFDGAVLVARDGKAILRAGYGLANREWGLPNGPDVKYRLASITKQFTSMLVMQLVEEGKLSLDAKLSDVLPWYRKDTGAKVTVRHLLRHTSGIPSYTSEPGFFRETARQFFETRPFAEKHCSGDLEFEPGTKWSYDNSGYFLLGAILEEIEKKPYDAILRARILDRLGMKDTGYDRLETILPRRASGYERRGAGASATYVNAPFLDMSLPFAAGALYSTADDLLKWDQALYGTALLSEKGKKEMWEPGLFDYAFGWFVKPARVGPAGAERTIVAHGGGINGFNTLIQRIPEDRILVVLLCNTGAGPLNAMATGAVDVLQGRTPAPPKRSVVDVLMTTFAEKGAAAGTAEYRRLVDAKVPDVDLSEGTVNLLGYQLLGARKVDEAIAVFELNAEAHPDSWNVFDSLAEAQAAKGLKEDAIRNYEKSLRMNPKNDGAAEALKKLRAN